MADVAVSALPLADPLDGTESSPILQTVLKRALASFLRDYTSWPRPTDWPVMPAPAANTIRIASAVFDVASNHRAIRMSTSSGTWSIDWGDGTTQTGIASGVSAEHNPSFSDVDLPAATTRGYKVALVTITADSGNFTVFNPSIAHSTVPNGTPPWLEIQVHGSSLTTLTLTTNALRLVERINFVAVGAVTSVGFINMVNLRRLDLPAGFFSAVTNWQTMFLGCARLRSVDLSSMPAGVTTMLGAFSGCTSLLELVFPSGTLASVTSFVQTFATCTSLLKLVFPTGAGAACLSCFQIVASCPSLTHLKFPNSFATTMTGAGGGWGQAFDGCYNLRHLKFGTSVFASLTSGPPTFASCSSLARIEGLAVPISFSVASCRLEAAALDEIYTALPSVTATITVSSNPGTAADTPSIATGKGWTVMGS
jgi:BspA type Leucine rich repeat region (6 copies)